MGVGWGEAPRASARVESDSLRFRPQDRAAIPRLLQPACAAEAVLEPNGACGETEGQHHNRMLCLSSSLQLGSAPGQAATPCHK